MRFQLILLFTVLLWGTACQQNTPSKKDKEQAKDQVSKSDRATIADIEREIRSHINDVIEREGKFQIQKDSQALDLQLVRVHTEYLSVLGPNEFFACVDLATTDGDVYDVDFFLQGTKNEMEVSQKSLHKLNGKPFYTWKQTEDGSWTTVPVENASPDLMGVKEGTDSFQFTYRFVLPDWEGTANLWLPIAGNDDYQQIHAIDMDIPFVFKEKREEQFGNAYIYASVDEKYAEDTLRIQYNITRKEKSAYPGSQLEAGRYLGSTPFLPVGGPFQDLAVNIIEKKRQKQILLKPVHYMTTSVTVCAMRKKALMAPQMPSTPATLNPVIAPNFTVYSFLLREVYLFQLVLRLEQQFPPSGMKAE